MKIIIVCALVALCSVATQANGWGKSVNININKNYDGPNFVDILSNLVRAKMDLKNNLWNSLLAAKSKTVTVNYSYQPPPPPPPPPTYVKTITINKGYVPVHKTVDVHVQSHKQVDVEVNTPPPIPVKKPAPCVEHEKTFEFNGSFSSGHSSSTASESGDSSQYLPPKVSGRSDSDLVDISAFQDKSDE